MTTKRVSVAGVARRERSADKKLRDTMTKERGKTVDSFVNFNQKMGIGADNPLSTAAYGFNPITRIRTQLEWIHRGSWLGGVAVDLVADDMTRTGVEINAELNPKHKEKIEEAVVALQVWPRLKETIQWSRLYGGAVAVMMIDGQDYKTPLRLETVGKGDFKGLLVLDRWMVEPSMSDLVTQPGPDLGLPKFYTITADAPALPRIKIHHSRCVRLEGIRLPYWQRVMENLWGISVIERLYDRMVAFDSATTGAAQLVYKAYVRTYAIKGLRDVISAGGEPLNGLVKYVDMMRRFQGLEGMTLIDGDDKMEAMQHSAFGGLSDALMQFGQQLSGALQIPLVRLFGQSPAGLNSTGESDLRMYYDNINKMQESDLRIPITRIYRAIAMSEGIRLPEGTRINFKSLWQLTDKEKAEIAETVGRAVGAAEEGGLISQQAAMKELQQSSHITGIFTNITDDDIEAAEETLPPAGQEAIDLGDAGSEGDDPGGTSKKKDKEKKGGKEEKKKKKTRDTITTVSGLKRMHELDVVIENPRGSIRTGGQGNHTWSVVMPYDYGYFRKTKAPDGEGVDCCIGPDLTSEKVWVIDQIKIESGAPDEPKALVGYTTLPEALSSFLQGYSDGKGWDRIGTTRFFKMEDFREKFLPIYRSDAP